MKVGAYELGKTVGRGAFSKVKVAVHMETGVEYVVKIIDKTGGGNKTPKEVKQEVRVEIGIMKVLNHPNIVRMYEVMESSKHFYIVLESVRGGDLCDHIMDAGKLSEPVAKKYLMDLCQGISACHAAGVAHRDIKPENCLISTTGVLKVADFGLSRLHRGRGDVYDQSDMSTDSVGTLSYAAPEVLDGNWNAFKADLWSTGVVLFVMLTGKFPFGSKGYTDAQIQEDIRKGKINKFPSHVSEEAKALVKSLIIVDPDKRMPLDEVIKSRWLTGIEPTSPTATAPSPPPLKAVSKDKQLAHHAKRPGALDMRSVQAEARANQAEAIASTHSPTWADSPLGGNTRTKFTPALFSPTARDSPKAATSFTSPPPVSSSSSAFDGVMDMEALKGLLEQEGKELGK